MKQAKICRVPERPPFPFSYEKVDQLKKYSKNRLGITPKPPKEPPEDKTPPSNKIIDPDHDWEELGYKLS